MGGARCHGCGDRDKRRALALRQLGRAHATGALGELAGGLGDVAADTWPSTGAIDTETASLATSVAQLGKDIFDGFGRASYPTGDPGVESLQNAWNAFLADFNQWQASAYFWNPSRRDELIGYRARFNALLAQWRAVPSVVTVAAPVAGAAPEKNPIEKAVDKAVDIAKWAALLVGAVAAFKVASDLGVVAKIGNLIGGGGAAAPGRRYGSAKLRSNPRDDLARPAGLTPFGDAAYDIIVAYLHAHGLTETGGCKAFYKPRKGKPKVQSADVLRVVYEGSAVREAMDGDSPLYPALAKKLDKLAMWIDYANDYTAVVMVDWNHPRVLAMYGGG